MKLEKENVVYTTTDLDRIADLKAKGFKEVKVKIHEPEPMVIEEEPKAKTKK
jgi:hypothetical protein